MIVISLCALHFNYQQIMAPIRGYGLVSVWVEKLLKHILIHANLCSSPDYLPCIAVVRFQFYDSTTIIVSKLQFGVVHPLLEWIPFPDSVETESAVIP